MSLLRRVERSGQGPPRDRPPSRPRQSPSPIRELWHHVAEGKLFTVTMTRDSRFIIAGSQAGEILFFDIAGRLLWQGKVAGAVRRLALAEDAECFLVGTIGGQGAYLWHYSGRLLHTFAVEGDTWGIDITPDASLTVISTQHKRLYGFDRNGAAQFDQAVNSVILNLAVSADGEMIFAGSDDQHVVAYDRTGSQRWAYQTGGRVWAGIRIAEQGRVLIAGSNDGYAYCFDFDGQERWKFDTGGAVNTLAITPDGRLSAAAGLSNTAYVLNDEGNVLWEYQTGDHIYGLDLSPDGRFLVIGSNDSNLYLVDRQDTPRVWKYATRGRVYGAALAPNGRYFAGASADQNVYAFRNTQVDDDPDVLTRLDSKPLMRLIVQRVYDEYANAPHAGLVRWFSEFEKSLRSHQFDACRALLAAADDERGFQLSDGEKQYIRSLEGVYWLMRGVTHHRHGQYEEARACYEKSKALQESLNNQDGTGQVVAVLSLLPPPSAEGETPPDTALTDECRALLDEITGKPRVLGMSEQLLAQRLTIVSPAEQLQIILLAQQSGYVTPLIKGLSADERVIRAAASAGLALLDPGPGYDVLAQMLESPLLFVKWQALRMLRSRANQRADEFKAAKAQVWPIVIAPDMAEAPDPLARREAVLLAKEGGDDSDTPWLIERLGDLDPDVQIAAAEALGAVGDRRALPKLARVQNKIGFLGRDLGTAAADARSAIETRHPTPTIEQVILCDADPLQQESVQQSTLFLTDTGTIYGIVTVDHVKPGAHVTVRWLDGDTVLKEEQISIPDRSNTQPIAEIQETEIVEDSSEASQLPLRRRSPFSRVNADEPSRLSPFRRRSLFAQDDEEEDDDNPFADGPLEPGRRRFRPLERRPIDERPEIPSFLRDRPGFSRPPSEDASRPRPFGERGRFGGSSTNPPRTRPSLGGAAPRRPARVTDPNENVAAVEQPTTADDGNEQADSPVSSRPSLPGRFGGGRPGAPRPGSSQEAELPPGLRRRDDQDDLDVPEFLRARPFDRAVPERSPFGRFGRSSTPDRPFPGRAARSGPGPTAQPLVFSRPCPMGGWKAAAYQIEVTLDEAAATHQTSFQFIESIKLTGLEPGIIAQRADSFDGTSTFLVGAPYVDGLVHLEQAPINARVSGRVYSVTTGTLVAETAALTQKQGRQSVPLSWENTAWQSGHYRMVAAVEHGNELHADIELVTKIRADRIVLCHQVDKNNGPVGADWPFRPGDQCYCVVEFNAPPSGVEVTAAWYRQHENTPITQTRPYVTSAAPDQRSVFRLSPRDRNAALTPGHYSVILEGKNLVREELTFEVLPYSRAQIVQRAAQSAYQKAAPLIEKYHLAQVLLSLFLTALLVLALWLADMALGHVLSAHQRSGDAILRLAHAISRPGVDWGLGWVAFGGMYAVLRTRHVESLSKAGEERLYSAINLLLAFASSALVWYLASTIAFGAGYLWPGKWWGFLDKLLWLSPIVAWLAPITGLVLVEWQRQEDREKPFHLSPVRAMLGVIGLMLIGWSGALVIGFPLGLLGGGLGEIVDAAGVSNHLGHGFLTVGAGVGFILGLVAILPYALRDDLIALGKEWFQRKQQDSGPHPNLLTFLIDEDALPGKSRDYLLAAAIARRGLLVIGVAVPALIVGFRPVVLPVLGFFYGASGNPAFDVAVTSSKWAAAAAVALLLVWPVLILSIQQRIWSPLLSAGDAAFTRGFSIAAAVSIGIVPLVILLTGDPIMERAPNVDVGLFWTNHAAALVLLIALGGWLAILIAKLPDSLRALFEFDSSTEELTVIGIALLAGVLLPGWMWALLLIVVMLIASSTLLLQRIE
jgi:outer membrane protein assembly factor BamB